MLGVHIRTVLRMADPRIDCGMGLAATELEDKALAVPKIACVTIILVVPKVVSEMC